MDERRTSNRAVIALDAMGGDQAPEVVVAGAVSAAGPDIKVILTGRTEEIERCLTGVDEEKRRHLEVVDAPDVIGFDEEPAKAVRGKPRSSLVAAVETVAQGRAGGIVSAGSTGATMAASLIKLRRLKGLKRPGLCVVIPTPGKPTVFIDVGANSEVRPAHLLEFANMASIFASEVLDISDPSVGLVSIGEESIKGNELVLEAHQLLAASPTLNFYGNIEGHDIVNNLVDVVVTDGFTGNVCLKLMEGTSLVVIEEIKKAARKGIASKLGGLLLKRNLGELKESIDPEVYSGAYLLGVRGLVVVCHGNSSSKAIANAVRITARAVEHEVVGRIGDRIASLARTSP
ncbi:phosphate acyltransferase [bacterium BMS3Abin01]|nr:phosphate acyltransferase [bacterium BMS3Abin01]